MRFQAASHNATPFENPRSPAPLLAASARARWRPPPASAPPQAPLPSARHIRAAVGEDFEAFEQPVLDPPRHAGVGAPDLASAPPAAADACSRRRVVQQQLCAAAAVTYSSSQHARGRARPGIRWRGEQLMPPGCGVWPTTIRRAPCCTAPARGHAGVTQGSSDVAALAYGGGHTAAVVRSSSLVLALSAARPYKQYIEYIQRRIH